MRFRALEQRAERGRDREGLSVIQRNAASLRGMDLAASADRKLLWG
jgi:hypothetical protein